MYALFIFIAELGRGKLQFIVPATYSRDLVWVCQKHRTGWGTGVGWERRQIKVAALIQMKAGK